MANNIPKKQASVFGRVLLKISGEALGGTQEFGIDPATLRGVCDEIASASALGIGLGIVIGGGNFIRGGSAQLGVNRVTGDQMGMLGTVMNALAMQDALEQMGVPARLQTAFAVQQIAEPFILPKAIRHLEEGRVVLFAGGTGNPFFTTDTAASLRAKQIQADILLKGTKVDGVYSDDPQKNARAQLFERLTYLDVVDRHLAVMDMTAITFCMDHKIPVRVFNFRQRGNLCRILQGESIGTLIAS